MGKLLLYIALVLFASLSLKAQEEDLNPNGYNVLYYPNGKVLSEGNMRDGKPEGYWLTYYTTGVIKSGGNRKNYLLDSIWVFYNSTGDTIKKINYLLGKKNGYYYEYYTDRSKPEYIGQIKSQELFVNDTKEGKSYYYFAEGKLREMVSYTNNKKNGIGIEYAKDDGRIITITRYNKGSMAERDRINRYDSEKLKDREWREFYDGVKVHIESNYKAGLLHGYYKEYDPRGRLIHTLLYDEGKLINDVENIERDVVVRENKSEDGSFVDRGPYVDDIPIGVHKRINANGDVIDSWIYDDNGVLLSKGIIDREGKHQRDWIDYYRNGTVKDRGKYTNNLREGKWVFYFQSGKIEQEGYYKRGKEQDLWTWYYPGGNIFIEEEYYNGRLEGKYSEYDDLGNILTEGEYFDGEKEGDWIVSINDFVAKGKYITGFEDGKWKYFYGDGTLMFDGNYIQGQADGKHKYFYPNATLKEEQYYAGGIPDKHWKKYDKEGSLIVTISYAQGKEYRINGVKVEFPGDDTVIIK